MALKFNPKTGEWDEVADAPSDPVSRIGVYFKGFYSSKLDDSASWLVFVGYAIVLLAVFSISAILGIVLLIGLFFEKHATWKWSSAGLSASRLRICYPGFSTINGR